MVFSVCGAVRVACAPHVISGVGDIMPGSTTGTWGRGPTKAVRLIDTDAGGGGAEPRMSASVSCASLSWRVLAAMPALGRIREEFTRACSGSDIGSISPESLARHWCRLAEDERQRGGHGALGSQDKQVIALRVSQAFQEMDLKANGRVDMDEWVHHMLLEHLSTPCVSASQINSLLQEALVDNPSILSDLQQMFQAADVFGVGHLSFAQVVAMYRRKLWHLRPTRDGTTLSEAELQSGDPEQFARDIIEVMDLDQDGKVSYIEFMAYCLGRRKHEVYLHVYDISNGMVQKLSPALFGETVDAIWHSGVVVYGKEYFFGGDIFYDTPGETGFGPPVKRIPIGFTVWRQDELHSFVVSELRPEFNREVYDVMTRNCNHFADRVCVWLTGHHIPEEVLRQPERLMQLTDTRGPRSILNRWLGNLRRPGGILPNRQGGGSSSSSSSASSSSFGSSTKRSVALHGRAQERHSLPAGTVVTIPVGHHPGVLGVVCCLDPRQSSCGFRSPMGGARGVTSLRGAALTPPDKAWVCYFSTTSDGHEMEGGAYATSFSTSWSRGRIRTELLPLARIFAVRLHDVGCEASFQAALQAMPRPSELLGPPGGCSGGVGPLCAPTGGGCSLAAAALAVAASGASSGLTPQVAAAPGSMHKESPPDSPLLSEDDWPAAGSGSSLPSSSLDTGEEQELDLREVVHASKATITSFMSRRDWIVSDEGCHFDDRALGRRSRLRPVPTRPRLRPLSPGMDSPPSEPDEDIYLAGDEYNQANPQDGVHGIVAMEEGLAAMRLGRLLDRGDKHNLHGHGCLMFSNSSSRVASL